jgi:predicted MPP superfamily phosphohydrolase
LKRLFTAVWLTGILAVLEVIRELHSFKVTRYTISSAKLAGLKGMKKIIFLSDLHNCCYGRNNEKLFEEIKKEAPDLILIGGDMLLRTDGNDYGGTARFLSRLPKLGSVYYANGNHEQKLKERPKKYEQSYKEYKKELVRAGIHFLENTSEELTLGTCMIRVTGLEIPLKGYERFGKSRLCMQEIEERIGGHKDVYEILLAHHPAYTELYQEWGADLILCGHYHGGIIGIPGIGGMIAPDFTLFPKYSGGCYKVKDAAAVVSRGIGTHSIPVRLLNPAEIVVIELVES